MKATRLNAIGDLGLAEVPVPELRPGEILVKVAACGICGTDRHLFRGEFPSRPPVTLGHEFTGIVTARAPDVHGIALGQRVTCDPNIACGTCPACRVGRVNLCRNLQAIGLTRDGGFAEYAAIPATQAFVLPDALHPHHGAFCEPLACCIHGVDMGAPVPGERVIVLGGGVIGLLTLQLVRNAGADAMLVTRQSAKRDLARELGAKETAATPEEALAVWPDGADLVIECAGVAETVEMAPRLARSGGRIVVLGVLAAREKVRIEPFDLLFREVQMLFSFINPFTQGRAAQLIAEGRIAVAPLLSRTLALEEAAAAIKAPPRPGEIRALVIPD